MVFTVEVTMVLIPPKDSLHALESLLSKLILKEFIVQCVLKTKSESPEVTLSLSSGVILLKTLPYFLSWEINGSFQALYILNPRIKACACVQHGLHVWGVRDSRVFF